MFDGAQVKDFFTKASGVVSTFLYIPSKAQCSENLTLTVQEIQKFKIDLTERDFINAALGRVKQADVDAKICLAHLQQEGVLPCGAPEPAPYKKQF